MSKNYFTFEEIRSMPKVSLHDHLDGAVRAKTILEIAEEQNIDLPAKDEASLARWISEKCSRGSLEEYLEAFALTSSVMQTFEGLRQIAREFVLDCMSDGIIYVECRWAPFAHLRGGLRVEEAIEAVTIGLAEGVSIAATLDYTIYAKQIFCALRHERHSNELAKLALLNRVHGVVGFDLAGPERGFPASMHSESLNLLAREEFPVTIHAGEADGIQSIYSALVDGKARRIGHGVRIAADIHYSGEDFQLGDVARRVLDSGITLELAPRSNLQTNASLEFGPDLRSHPFDLLYRLGFAVTVNPDNRLMSDTSVTEELYDLAVVHNYSAFDIRQFQENAIQASFCDSETLVNCQKMLQGITDSGSN